MKKRTTRRALVMSLLSLLLCCSMLVGTTFAWFTDSVTSGKNTIIAGNLDIELYYQVEGKTDWIKVTEDSNIFMENALWEPGHTEVVKLKVVNEGTLALKYQLGVNVAEEIGSINKDGNPFKLSDYIKFAVIEGDKTYTREQAVAAAEAADATALNEAYNSGTLELASKAEKVVTMVVYMPTTVDNRANYGKDQVVPEILLGLTLNATQLTAEKDSFDENYDKDAWANALQVNSVAELALALETVEDGGMIVFGSDIQNADGIELADKNITIDLNGKTFTVSEGASTNNRNFKINGTSEVTIKNGTMVAAGELNSGAYGTIRTEGSAKVTLDNVKLYNYRGNGLNIKACSGTTVIVNNSEIYSQYGGGVEAAGGTVELNDVKIEQKGMWTAPYNSMAISVNGGGKATVNSGTYTTECLTAEEANNQGTSHGPWTIGVLNSGGTLIVNGGTFSNDNFGDNSLATYARGLVLADTGAVIKINGGEFNAMKAIIDVTNNLGDVSKNPSATLSGGTFSADPRVSGLYASHLIQVADGYKVVPSNGNYIVVSADTITTTDELVAAINAGKTNIELLPGEYALRFTNNTSFNVDNTTIKGIGEVKLAISSSEAWYGRIQGNNVVFENIHFTSAVGATGEATYNDCTFDSWAICASGNEKTYYNNCTINGCLNTSTDFSSDDVFVKDSEIVKAEYSGSMTMNFENCQIGELIIWNANTNLNDCEVTTLDKSNVTTAIIRIDGIY